MLFPYQIEIEDGLQPARLDALVGKVLGRDVEAGRAVCEEDLENR